MNTDRGIQGMRGFASLMVMYFHMALFAPFVLPVIPFAILFSGWSGVVLFFVISGYILTKKFDEHEYEIQQKFSVVKFYIRRVFRIWPLYIIFVPIFAYVLKTPLIWQEFLFIQNYVPSTFSLTPLWTLCVEELFYLILPIWVLFFKGKYWYLHFLGAAAITGVYFLAVGQFLQPNNTACYSIAPLIIGAKSASCDTFLISQFPIYTMAYALGTLAARGKQLKMTTSVLVLTILVAFILMNQEGSIYDTLGFIAIFYLMLSNLKDNKFFTNKIMTFIGSLTYPIYLLSLLVLIVAQRLIPDPNLYLVVVGIDLFGTIGLAYLIHKFVESPLIGLGRKIEKRIWTDDEKQGRSRTL